MGQINSCKCKCIKGEIGQEICIEDKSQKENKNIENKDIKLRSSFNKTLEEIINTNEEINTDGIWLSSNRIGDLNSYKISKVNSNDNGNRKDDVISVNSKKHSPKMLKNSSPNCLKKSPSSNSKKKSSIKNNSSIKSPNKKQLNDNVNFNSSARAPLEIINEYHGDNSIEIFPEIRQDQSYQEQELFQKINLKRMYNLDKSTNNPDKKMYNSSYSNSKNLKTFTNSASLQHKSKFSKKVITNLKYINHNTNETNDDKSYFLLNNTSINYIYKNGNSNFIDSQELENFKKSTNVKLLKKKIKNNFSEVERKIKETNIFSLFSEKRLLQSNENDIIYHTELFKFSIPGVHYSNPYSSKYCVVNRREFKYFKSKEAFFRLSQPLFSLSLSRLSLCDYFKEEKDKTHGNLHHFYIKMEPESSKKQLNPDLPKIQNTDLSLIERSILIKDQLLCIINPEKKEEIRKAKKIQLIDEVNILGETLKKKKDFEIADKSIIIWACNQEEVVVKWIKILNYLFRHN